MKPPLKLPRQPLMVNFNEAVHFVPNQIVKYLVEHGSVGMPHLFPILRTFPIRERCQFIQLLGTMVTTQRQVKGSKFNYVPQRVVDNFLRKSFIARQKHSQKLPMQPITVKNQVIRFVPNSIVQYLIANGNVDMNEIGTMGFTKHDRSQFAQLLGYSVSGWFELPYVESSVKDGNVTFY